MIFPGSFFSLIAASVVCAFALGAPTGAQTAAETGVLAALPDPSGPVVLTMSAGQGEAGEAQAAPPIRFDQAMLAALPQVTFTTTTIWTDGPQEFTGVPLSALLSATGLTGKTVMAMAANDYLIELPVAELSGQAPIVAYLRNGKPMTTRDKGPLWIVYPYDSDPAYRSEVIYARSIWQLDRIEVLP